jgi:hypothetical protein
MQKDVIYIDVEDDITAIIDKVKKSKEKVVALVPPKRIGVLQSAVNLRLLTRAAGNANKRLVLITSNAALSGLAASAKIPVAKNLQTKPEIAEIPALKVDDDDVINGEELPAHDHAAAAETSSAIPASKIEGIDIDGTKAATDAPSKRAKSAKKGVKVPDFGTFRKKAFLFGGLGVLLIVFFVWAIWFAPRATVIVNAETSDQNLSLAVSVGPDLETDVSQEHLKGVRQEDKVTQTIEFDATGTKDVGEKATGEVTFTTNDFVLIARGTTIPAGTILSTPGGLLFTTTESATFELQAGGNQRTVGVVASSSGTQYNGFSGNVSGAPSGVTAKINNPTSGGTTKEIKVVTQADINRATVQLTDQGNDEAKKNLIAKFESGTMPIDSSFKSRTSDPKSSPALGQEATGKAKLTQETTYTIMGVSKQQLDSYLDEALQETLNNKDEQKIYDNGVSTVKFADFAQNEGDQAGTVSITAVAQIGPKIDDNEIKEQVKGKRYGEIAGDLKAIDGVSDVEVNLSPFWVQSVPNDTKKITVEFELKKNDG